MLSEISFEIGDEVRIGRPAPFLPRGARTPGKTLARELVACCSCIRQPGGGFFWDRKSSLILAIILRGMSERNIRGRF